MRWFFVFFVFFNFAIGADVGYVTLELTEEHSVFLLSFSGLLYGGILAIIMIWSAM